MSRNLNVDAYEMLKQHAVLVGDCVVIYDPELDLVTEYTDCFDNIVNLASKDKNIKQAWLAKIKQAGEVAQKAIFESSQDNRVSQFYYHLNNVDGDLHYIHHLSYPYFDHNEKLLFLIVLRDYDHKPQSIAHQILKTEDWRKEDSSQIRHLRQLVSQLYVDAQADFVMVALPSENHDKAKSLVAIRNGKFLDEFDYELVGTPCEITVKGSFCTHSQDIQSLYPSDAMLADMLAESYVGVPFFDDKGEVLAYLVIISKAILPCQSHYEKIIEKYQAKLNRRIQLYIADQHIAEFSHKSFDLNQFALGSAPSSEELINWSDLSAETFNSLKEAIFITDANNVFVQINKAFTEITGYTYPEIIGKTPNLLSSGLHDETFYQTMSESLATHGMWEGEIINKTKQGKNFSEWLYIRVIYDNNQEITHYIAVFSDISAHKEKEELLYFQANYDPLTMLPNRSLLFYTLAEKVAKLADLPDATLYLLHVDLNGLARINENYNYQVGDNLLIETSRRLKKLMGPEAFIARISGDNFVIILSSHDNNFDINDLASLTCQELAMPINFGDLQVKISADIGIALTNDHHLATDSFYSMAEQALFKSKIDGVKSFFIFDENLQNELKTQWELEQELTIAIDEDQFELYYQPQVDSHTGKLLGVEALVRWHHPDKGMLAPALFIPLAENIGQIVPLGNLILEKACQQISAWTEAFTDKFKVSVNISPRQFALEHTHGTMKNIIENSKIDKSRITLEITEDVLMADHSDLLEVLGEIRASGIELSLDDFGTGFSSLSYLQQYPLNELKIDQSFISSLETKPESYTIVKAIIAMAKGLDLKVVAEGVETLQQREILSSLGCDIFQGYYFAKPMPAFEMGEYIASLGKQ